jgi:hypothetical protein
MFEDETSATDGVQRLVDSEIDPASVSAMIHEGELHHEDLPARATHVRRRTVEGSLVGAGLGALLGGLFAGPAGLIGMGAVAAAMLGTGGGLYGGLAGALVGNDDVKDEFAALAVQVAAGKVLVAVVVQGAEPEARVIELLTAAGGRAVAIA